MFNPVIDASCHWCCPICGSALTFDQSYRCVNGHCFDRAKEGYVNLLPANRKHSTSPGDSKAMLQHRRRFLDRHFYQPLAHKIVAMCEQSLAVGARNISLLDTGCGEGYYTHQLQLALQSALTSTQTLWLGGIDISKEAIRMAAKRYRDIQFAVASTTRIPVANQSMDVILRIFAPGTASEVVRCLKPGGHYLTVTPGPGHLHSLRACVYDNPTEHQTQTEHIEGLRLQETQTLSFPLQLESSEDIVNLFSMTPYYWQTSRKKQEHIFNLKQLDTQADFRINLYQS